MTSEIRDEKEGYTLFLACWHSSPLMWDKILFCEFVLASPGSRDVTGSQGTWTLLSGRPVSVFSATLVVGIPTQISVSYLAQGTVP